MFSNLKQVSANRFLSITGDETTHVTGKEQFSLLLCHATSDFKVREDFTGLYEVDKSDAESFYIASLDRTPDKEPDVVESLVQTQKLQNFDSCQLEHSARSRCSCLWSTRQ